MTRRRWAYVALLAGVVLLAFVIKTAIRARQPVSQPETREASSPVPPLPAHVPRPTPDPDPRSEDPTTNAPASAPTWDLKRRLILFRPPSYSKHYAGKERSIVGQTAILTRKKADADLNAVIQAVEEIDDRLQRLLGADSNPGAVKDRLVAMATGLDASASDDDVRVRAIMRLSELALDADAAKALARVAGADASPGVRVAAAAVLAVWGCADEVSRWLARQNDVEALQDFLGALQYPTLLDEGRFPLTIAPAIASLTTRYDDPLVRGRALHCLGYCPDSPEAVECMLRELRTASSYEVRIQAVVAIRSAAKHADVRAELLKLAADGTDEMTAYFAVSAFRGRLNRQELSVLGEVAGRQGEAVSRAAIDTLIIAADRENPDRSYIVSILEDVSRRHPDQSIRDEAKAALAKLGR